MPICEKIIDENLTGGSTESYTLVFEYGDDLNNDGLADIKVTVKLTDPASNPTEDIIGIAFDYNEDATTTDLMISDITLLAGTTTTVPVAILDPDRVADDMNDPGFSTSGGDSAEPYDAGILISAPGSGDGIAQSFSFILSDPTNDLDINDLLAGTNWFVRAQSTDGGEGSAKTGEFIDEFDCDEPHNGNPGMGNTPGFWKNHEAIFEQETGLSHSDSYEDLFGVDVVGSKKVSDEPTLLEALSAQGGGEAAFLRASTAAYANATSDDVNYSYHDVESLRDSINNHYGLDPESTSYDADFANAHADFLAGAEAIDLDGDGDLDEGELKSLVTDVFNDGTRATFTSAATILDIMNNMPSVEVEDFEPEVVEDEEPLFDLVF